MGMHGAFFAKTDAGVPSGCEKVDELFQRHADFFESLEADEDSDRMGLTEVAQPALLQSRSESRRCCGLGAYCLLPWSAGRGRRSVQRGPVVRCLEQAVAVIAARSSHRGRRGTGGMTAVGLGEAAAVSLLEDAGLDDKLTVAGINSPRGVTLAGSIEDLQAFELRLTEREVFQRRLKLDYAFHSPAMRPDCRSDTEGSARSATACLDNSFLFSRCRQSACRRAAGCGLLVAQRAQPVRFQQAINAMIVAGHNCFIEIGPNAILRNYVSDCLRDQSVEVRS